MENNNLLKNVNLNAAKDFINKASVDYSEKSYEKNKSFNLSWLEKFEETLPYIDNIIRNPRRFIINEEEVTIIEKTKKINEDSIKHLAKNTNLVRDIDDDGFVKPAKLLNVYKEETYDLYENRFMYTLVNRLYTFINKVLNSEGYDSFVNKRKEVDYNGETEINGEKVKIKLNLELNSKENKNITITDMDEVAKRIENLKDTIYGFISSDFIRGLTQAVPVKSPIKKTNVFLKEQNFKKTLELWEFLDGYEDTDITSIVENKTDEINLERKSNFDLLYYISYNIFRPSKEKIENNETPPEEGSVYKFIENFILSFDGGEKEFKKFIQNQYRIVINKKKKDIDEVNKVFRKVVLKYNLRKKKALK